MALPPNLVVFDIETVPDVAAGRRLLGLADLDDHQVAEAMFGRQRARSGNDFLRLHLHRVVAVSIAMRRSDGTFRVWSVGTIESDEKELIERFFEGIERYTPNLVSWNGSGFDLPVLHYRSLLHGVQAPRYWDTGDDDTGFRWNNYLNRFHWRHTDLMDVLAGYQGRATAPLDEIATLLGFPGKMGMDGSKVWDSFLAGDLKAIRDYCETDVLNTYLVYLRFELIRGRLAEPEYGLALEQVQRTLADADETHLSVFLSEMERVDETSA
jgi:predicted PolB exonuclease-like 3'-5' exonuclease